MKLPNFINADIFNVLRSKMNADLVEANSIDWDSFDSQALLRKLNSIEGIEANISDIEFSSDNTFEYKGQKVLVYIRDQKVNPNYEQKKDGYKFHICKCNTIDRFIKNKRLDRYVVSTRTDGRFLVNIVDSWSKQYIEEGVIKELNVCKTCLMELHYKGYSKHVEGINIYNGFSLEEFFSFYSTKFTVKPKHTEKTAPPDIYDPESKKYFTMIKAANNWSCQECGINLLDHKKYLHIHHISGVKADNRRSNLKCLCIECHSNQPDHQHLKYGYPFYQFNQIFKGGI